jgi:hypothetical protein
MAKAKKAEKPEPTEDQINFIKAEHTAANAAGKTALEHAIACGVALINIKDNTKHGKWEDWVEQTAGISKRTASRYKWCAENQAKLQAAADAGFDVTIRSAPDILEEYELSLKSEAEQKAAAAKKLADQAQRQADQEKAKKAEVETAAKEYIEKHPELVVPVPSPAPTPPTPEDLQSFLKGRKGREICEAICKTVPVEEQFTLAIGVVEFVMGGKDTPQDRIRAYAKQLTELINAIVPPEQAKAQQKKAA